MRVSGGFIANNSRGTSGLVTSLSLLYPVHIVYPSRRNVATRRRVVGLRGGTDARDFRAARAGGGGADVAISTQVVENLGVGMRTGDDRHAAQGEAVLYVLGEEHAAAGFGGGGKDDCIPDGECGHRTTRGESTASVVGITVTRGRPRPQTRAAACPPKTGPSGQNIEQFSQDLYGDDERGRRDSSDDRCNLLSLRFIVGMQGLGVDDDVGV